VWDQGNALRQSAFGHSDGIHGSRGRKDLIPVMIWFIVPRDETGHAFDRDKSVI
jgi:hypothetical protein